ncbi:MAG: hypothetical protein ACE5D7_07505 [Fidelibacterota bacterium]
MSKHAIDIFIQNLTEFVPDEVLKPVTDKSDSMSNYFKMVADAGNEKLTVYKIGSLCNDNRDMLVRVFKNDMKKQFELYFVGTEEKLRNYPIVLAPESFKYYIIDENGFTSIPYDSNLDPLLANLTVTFPVSGFSFSLENIKAPKNVSINSDYLTITDIESGSKILFIFLEESGTKVFRLIPVREGEAKVALPESIVGPLTVSIYR